MIKLPKLDRTLLLILGLALLARLWGIDHGLPFIYHPDEPALVRSAYGLRFGNLNPGHFDWPHFHFYLCFFIFESFIKFRALLQVLNLRSVLEQIAPLLWQDPAIFYFLARLAAVLMGTATVGLTYLIGKKLFNKKVGLVAALVLTFSTLHANQSHYALLDVPLGFWITLSVFFSVLILKKGRWRDYLLAGLFAGFAAATKYNGGFVVVAILAAHFLYIGPISPIRPILSGLASIVGFLIGMPYALLDFDNFKKGFLWQFENVQGHIGAEAANGWWFHFAHTLRNGLGTILLGFAVLGIILALVRRRRRDIFLISFPLLYFLYVGSWRVVYGRFMIPVLPMLCVLAASSVFFVAKKFQGSNLVLGALLGLALVQPVWSVVRSDRILTQVDTRTLAKEWADENLPDKSKVAMDTLFGADLDPFYLPNLRRTKGEEDQEKGFYLYSWSRISDASPATESEAFLSDWKEEGLDYLITSSLVHGRFFKESTEELHPEVVQVQDEYLWFDANFKLLKKFSSNGVRPGPVIKIYQVR